MYENLNNAKQKNEDYIISNVNICKLVCCASIFNTK